MPFIPSENFFQLLIPKMYNFIGVLSIIFTYFELIRNELSLGGIPKRWTMNINCTFQSSWNIYEEMKGVMCPKWGHIICQWHSGAAQGDDQVRSRKGARDSVAVLKSALRIPKASMASVEVINSEAVARETGPGNQTL